MNHTLEYITPCRHHIVVSEIEKLISIIHVADVGNNFIINHEIPLCKASVAAKEMTEHFIFLANFCSLQDA